ncbi:MAG: GatB/Yqey family protein [Candidatus Woesebacteria bacterium GW2011_GWA2_40_7b]|uniref:GatB/Yqey family protein n=1 Tax=Candidatus Woesebacteria bacterium GW2011_GWA2_40_7b TaxID=1618563 RepID=A0A0G0T092_9BACT|nr:MAG: GatB/Yqey family protein [Candidatus Woesebacteria bacterium GW2011_GWA2_40_7b]
MIAGKLQQIIGEAMKAHDELRTSTLRLLSSAFNYEKIAKQHELTEEEELVVIQKEAKQRRDSIEAYKKAGAEDRAQKEDAELKILAEFLPPEMDEETLSKLVTDAITQMGAKSMADMGRVIGAVKAKAPNVDGGKIAQIVGLKLHD